MASSESVSTRNFLPADSQPLASHQVLYVRSRAIVSRYIAGETLVLPVRGDVGDLTRFYTLNETATTIWECLEKPRSVREICDVIEHKYDINKARAEEDMTIFVCEMCSLGLVNVAVEQEEKENHESACKNSWPA
jgi:coenzyme PQQ synthesis protein D (PqqD)